MNQKIKMANKAIGARFKQIRTAKGFRQSDIANIFGISFQQVQKYERGANRLSLVYLLLSLDEMGVSVEEFFDGFSWKTEPEIDTSQMDMFS